MLALGDEMTLQLPTMTPHDFVARWRDAGFGERQGAQSFFNDLCGLAGHATPAGYADPEAFTFEKWVPGGFADAYFEEHFGWEFKGQDAQLDGAFNQLLRYQVHLKTPPLLIVSSFETIRIQTNFPGMETARYDLGIGELEQPERLGLVRDVFFAPYRFRDRLRSVDAVTRETAAVLQSIVVDMEARNEDPERLARYLNQLVFCLYSEDAGLLPEGAVHARRRPTLSQSGNVRRGNTQPVHSDGYRRACRRRPNRPLQRRPVQRGRQRGVEHGCPATAGGGVRAELAGHRAVDIRDAVRAGAGRVQAGADEGALHRSGRHRAGGGAGGDDAAAPGVGGGAPGSQRPAG